MALGSREDAAHPAQRASRYLIPAAVTEDPTRRPVTLRDAVRLVGIGKTTRARQTPPVGPQFALGVQEIEVRLLHA
jgi:hypothetical protein